MKCIPGCIGAILLLATSLCAQPATESVSAGTPDSQTIAHVSPSGEDSLRTLVWHPGHVGTIVNQTLIGTLSGAVLGTVGTLAALGIARPDFAGSSGGGSPGAAVVGMVLMYLATSSGITYGVVGVGDLQGGTGDAWLTFLGSALGVAAGATTAILTKNTAGYITAGTLAIGTPVLFYHLSAEPVYEEHDPWTEWPYGSAILPTGMHDHISLLQLRIPLASD